MVGRRDGVVEEDLVELALSRQCPDGAYLDAGLIEFDQKEADAFVLRGWGSERANTKIQLASRALEVQSFWPLMTQWSPSSAARVDSDARSEPASGSEKP